MSISNLSQHAYRALNMPVAEASYAPLSKYPIIIHLPGSYVELTRDEAVDLVGGLLDAVNKHDSELKEAA